MVFRRSFVHSAALVSALTSLRGVCVCALATAVSTSLLLFALARVARRLAAPAVVSVTSPRLRPTACLLSSSAMSARSLPVAVCASSMRARSASISCCAPTMRLRRSSMRCSELMATPEPDENSAKICSSLSVLSVSSS